MGKRNQHAKQGFGVDDPQDSIHLGEGKRIRLEDIPAENTDGDLQVGNRAYNDARYQLKGTSSNNQSSFLEGGYLVWTGTGLEFNRPRTSYLLPGIDSPITVAASAVPITLDAADPTNPRFDIPVWDINGNFTIIKGTASPNPPIPAVTDPLTQIAGTPIFIPAGATTPGPEVPNTTVFDEAGPGEWATSSTGTGTAVFNATSNPKNGTIHGRATNIENNFSLIFTAAANISTADVTVIGFQLRLLAQLFAGQDIAIQFFNNAGGAVSNQVNLSIAKDQVNSYQFVSLPLEDFNFTASQFRQIHVIYRRRRGATVFSGFDIDVVQIQGGVIPPIVQGTVQLQGHVSGSGQTGTPIQVTITEKAISEQTEQTDPLPSTAEHMVRLADGSLRRVADSLIAANKVDKVAGKSLIDDTEIARLAGINDRFKGKYTSLAALETAVPTANAGDYAQVDTGGSNPVTNYNWDVEDGWVVGSTGGAPISNTDELPEGSTNLYFTGSRVLNTILAGLSLATNRAITAGDSILVAMGLLQKQITDALTSIGGKQDTLVSGTNIKTVNGESLLGNGNVVISTPEPTHRENNTVLFDADYITGVNASPRSGNILFDFTGAKRGATTLMYHQDASAYTMPSEAKKNFKNADVSTTKVNKYMFTLVKATSPQIVEVTLVWEGGEP